MLLFVYFRKIIIFNTYIPQSITYVINVSQLKSFSQMSKSFSSLLLYYYKQNPGNPEKFFQRKKQVYDIKCSHVYKYHFLSLNSMNIVCQELEVTERN